MRARTNSYLKAVIFILITGFFFYNVIIPGQSKNNSVASTSTDSGWVSFNVPQYDTSHYIADTGEIGVTVFKGSSGHLYSVSLDVNMTNISLTNFGNFSVNYPYFVDTYSSFINGKIDPTSVTMAEENNTGSVHFDFKNIVAVYIIGSGPIIGSYRAVSSVTKSPGFSISADTINLIGAVLALAISVSAIGFGMFRYYRGLKFKKLVDQYLLDQNKSLKNLVGDDEKLYLKAKKFLIDRNVLREADK